LLADHVGLEDATRERCDEHEAVDPTVEDVPRPPVTVDRARAKHDDAALHTRPE
jgi:hypothetical protein